MVSVLASVLGVEERAVDKSAGAEERLWSCNAAAEWREWECGISSSLAWI
jgi:hypothetical protein